MNTRAYELMIIIDGDEEDTTVDDVVSRVVASSCFFGTSASPARISAFFSKLDRVKERSKEGDFLRLIYKKTDDRINHGKSVSPAFLFAGVFWPEVNKRWNYVASDPKYMGALVRAIEEVSDVLSQTFIPKRLIADIRDIWYLQGRLLNRRGKKPTQVLRHQKFRAAYEFPLLFVKSREVS